MEDLVVLGNRGTIFESLSTPLVLSVSGVRNIGEIRLS